MSATYLFLTALMVMPIANVTAVLQVLPLSVTLSAALFLQEPVGWRRMAAIAAGFCGMLLIVRPGPEGFSDGALYALASAACITARDLVTRRMPPEVPSVTVTLASSLSVLAFGIATSAVVEWQPMSSSDLLILTGAGAVHLRRLPVLCHDHAGGRDRGDRALALQRVAVGAAAGLAGVRRMAGCNHPGRRRHRCGRRESSPSTASARSAADPAPRRFERLADLGGLDAEQGREFPLLLGGQQFDLHLLGAPLPGIVEPLWLRTHIGTSVIVTVGMWWWMR